MSIGESPPQQPPMLSPDGKWVWNGSEWLPIAGHGAVFAAWNAIRVDPVEVAPQVAAPAAVYAQAPAPVVQYAAVEPAEDVVPLWQQQPQTGLNKYLYIVAGVIALVVVVVAVNAFGISWPWSVHAPEGPPRAASLPPPVAVRSEAGRADYFLKGLLAPAMADVDQNAQILRETCNGTMTLSCQNAFSTTDKQVKHVVSVIDRAVIPSCIASSVTKLRQDLMSMDDAMQVVLQGYKENLSSEVIQGLSHFAAPAQRAQADLAANTAQRATCATQQVGP